MSDFKTMLFKKKKKRKTRKLERCTNGRHMHTA
jgi:hypothetical protein